MIGLLSLVSLGLWKRVRERERDAKEKIRQACESKKQCRFQLKWKRKKSGGVTKKAKAKPKNKTTPSTSSQGRAPCRCCAAAAAARSRRGGCVLLLLRRRQELHYHHLLQLQASSSSPPPAAASSRPLSGASACAPVPEGRRAALAPRRISNSIPLLAAKPPCVRAPVVSSSHQRGPRTHSVGAAPSRRRSAASQPARAPPPAGSGAKRFLLT